MNSGGKKKNVVNENFEFTNGIFEFTMVSLWLHFRVICTLIEQELAQIKRLACPFNKILHKISSLGSPAHVHIMTSKWFPEYPLSYNMCSTERLVSRSEASEVPSRCWDTVSHIKQHALEYTDTGKSKLERMETSAKKLKCREYLEYKLLLKK